MPNKSEEIRAAANMILSEMIDDLVLTTAIAAHREIKRGRVTCGTCGTRCRCHTPVLPSNLASTSSSGASTLLVPQSNGDNPGSSVASSRAATPSLASDSQGGRSGGYLVGPEKGTGGSTGIGSGSGRIDGSGNAFFDCLVCSRPISSNRYAPHLARCLGFGGSTRRTAARSAAAKVRMGTNDRSSPSPYVGTGSENGDWGSDADSVTGSKKKKAANGSAKRTGSPTKAVPKGKKAKIGSVSGSATPTPQFPRQALPPSKLGRPPTNRQPTTVLSSPASSPEKSVFSVASSSTGGGGNGGMTGAKTLPGMSAAGGFSAMGSYNGSAEGDSEVLPEIVLGDDSSEGGDDDY
ncbi:hypothetical protein IAT38_001494 [Cryptococcus sp. DSM 104549]